MPKSPNRLRVPLTMAEKMFSYLTKLSVRSRITGGKNLSMAEMINTVVDVCLLENDVYPTCIKDEEELKDRIKQSFRLVVSIYAKQ